MIRHRVSMPRPPKQEVKTRVRDFAVISPLPHAPRHVFSCTDPNWPAQAYVLLLIILLVPHALTHFAQPFHSLRISWQARLPASRKF